MRTLLLLGFLWSVAAPARLTAAETWPGALRQMPLSTNRALNRDNAIDLMLDAFCSNITVKALLVLPGVADDFYLIHRDAPKLNLNATNLFDAITGLTNVTDLRLTFRAPFLLLHFPRDMLRADVVSEDKSTTQWLKTGRHFPYVCWKDTHWEKVQPVVQDALKRPVRPNGPSSDAWHFNRHNLAGWSLSDWELLEAISLTGGTKVTVQKRAIVFKVRDTP